MSNYSKKEYLDMIKCYAETGYKLNRAQKLFSQMYKNRPVPEHSVILKAYRKLHDLGSTRKSKIKYGSKSSLGQQEDVLFCKWLVEDVTRSILWTGETTFCTDERFLKNNKYYWGHSKPKNFIDNSDHDGGVAIHVWMGMLGGRVLGPLFLEQRSGDGYNQVLKQVEEILDDVPLAFLRNFYFQHNRAPHHFSKPVCKYLNEQYPDHWIGKSGPIEWPSNSPDVNPVDFFLMAKIKDLVLGKMHKNKKADLKNENMFRECIINVFESVKKDIKTLEAVNMSVLCRANECLSDNRQDVK